ncbi:hypothetical protein ACJ72_05612 [Emergomyces africanus]|uniref:ERCC1-like central domain-containing protein n=1 Tax=Emergomyces africanus TaxID=1955775 RepID=A0A1B7NTE4_9EURO|nr:hypothetical protein ACJ72_05612 [Emergomyces africanus]
MDDDFGEVPEFEALLGSSKPDTNRSQASAPASLEQTPRVQQPKPQVLPNRSGPSAILVSARQRGNPILTHVRHVPWNMQIFPRTMSWGVQPYYRLHPEYIYARIKGLAGKYNLRILLTLIDIPNHEDSLRELSKTSLVNNLTLILCWSAAEAGHYLELFKSCEHAQPTAIRTQQSQSYNESLVEFITAPRSINKSDAASLISTFGSLQAAINAQPEQISAVPGWGERKVQQWHDAVRDDFQIRRTAKRSAKPPVDKTRETRTLQEVFNDEEHAFLTAHIEDIGSNGTNEQSATSSRQIQKGEGNNLADTSLETHPLKGDVPEPGGHRLDQPEKELNHGVMAALSKLRESGG